MPAAPQGVTIEPNGQSVVVVLTEQGGGSPTVYANRHGTATVSMPATITTRTTLFLVDPTTYTVSCKVSGLENANGAGGATTIDLSGGGVATVGVGVPVETDSIAKGTYPTVVVHGATATTARPTGALVVHWHGSVSPSNAAAGDLWYDTTTQLWKRYSGSAFVATGSLTYTPLNDATVKPRLGGITLGPTKPSDPRIPVFSSQVINASDSGTSDHIGHLFETQVKGDFTSDTGVDPGFAWGTNFFTTTGSSTGDANGMTLLYGGLIEADVAAPAGTTITKVVGLQAEASFFGAASAASVGTLMSMQIKVPTRKSGATAGSVTGTVYGLYIDSVPSGTLGAAAAYSIYNPGGSVYLGGDVTAGAGLTSKATGATSATLSIDSAATTSRDLRWLTSGGLRWILRSDSTAEDGSNNGSNFALLSRTDAGAALHSVLTVTRRNGILAAGIAFQNKVKAGTPTDADFASTPTDGTTIVDSTGSKIWCRIGGTWKSATLA